MTSTPHEARALFDFIAYTARLREVTRHNNATPSRKESVAEHSWHLAMISWVLHTEFERETGHTLDLTRMLKLSLMHDLVEIDAGDPSAWDTAPNDGDADGGSGDHGNGNGNGNGNDGGPGGSESESDKARIENAVARERFGSLPAPLGPELLALWREYEDATTPESRLVRGIDRLNPALMRYLTGQGWSDVGADAEALDRLQLPRVGVSPSLTALYEEVREAAKASGLLSRQRRS
ncbi:HD domain-containing protein [Streptomyces iconiensis]|uniref:5'-deoxynucleotidase n=1 Tax=Streptomyces iconiensis TaxID=1384038 RepID=A0ABT6ZXU9_9ACTN|nr:HD domain-containing protein [Streptomyces iconiensis]MDJ1133889.1 HD domain-containing protein [Streptomyces iconiensis]